MSAITSKRRFTRPADTLEDGDVIYWDREWWVVIEPSDSVTTIPLDQEIDGVPVTRCCEPRLQLLGPTGRATHICTFVIWPNAKRVIVGGFLDIDIRSAVPEWYS